MKKIEAFNLIEVTIALLILTVMSTQYLKYTLSNTNSVHKFYLQWQQQKQIILQDAIQ